MVEGSKSGKNNSNKHKNNINNCLSDRNVPTSRDTQKLFKYRKFSSNAELQQEDMCSGVVLKQKLSVMEGHKYFGPKDLLKKEKYSITAWIVTVRKYFGK
jgi:hypothetical protein